MGLLMDYYGIHSQDVPVIVCGIGPSLRPALDWLPNFITVGVNDICRFFAPDYLVVLDRIVKFEEQGDRLGHILAAREHCRAIFTPHHPDLSKYLEGSYADTVAFDFFKKEPFMKMVPDLTNAERLWIAITSPYTGISLAAYMGARRIGLIGVDFTGHELAEHMYEVNLDFRGLAEGCEAAGILLVNLSPGSLLEPLKKGDIKYLLYDSLP